MSKRCKCGMEVVGTTSMCLGCSLKRIAMKYTRTVYHNGNPIVVNLTGRRIDCAPMRTGCVLFDRDLIDSPYRLGAVPRLDKVTTAVNTYLTKRTRQ